MRIVKSELQSVLTKNYLLAGRPRLCVSMISAFSLLTPDHLLDESEPWGVAAARVDDLAPLDQFMPKARAEFLVGGSAYAPGGREVSGLEISVRVGSLFKQIDVLGDRYWHSTDTLQKFRQMPLTYARAFGGPDYPENPAGSGHASVSAGVDGLRLPNFLYPGRPAASPKDKIPPAGLGPVSLSASGRTRYLGTYGPEWQNTHWPGWPEDFNFAYFNAGAPDQWLEVFFSGNEPLEVRNLHPEKPLIESSLPGFRTRCFVTKHRASGSVIEEPQVRLDTLWLFPDALMGALIWRADLPVSDADASDVLEVLAVPEPLSAPLRTLEEYRKLLEPETVDVSGPTEVTAEPVPPVEASEEQIPTPPGPELSTPDDDANAALLKEMEASCREQEKSIASTLAAVGIGMDQILPPEGMQTDSPKPPLKAVDPEPFDPEKALKELEEAEAAFDEMTRSLNIAPPASDPPEPPESMKRILKQSPEETAVFLAGVLPKEAKPEAFMELVEESRQDTEKINRLLAEEEKQAAPSPPPTPEKDGEAADPDEPWTRERVLSAFKRGISLAGIDISGLDLSGANLSGADLNGVIANGTNFEQADLSKAKLTDAVLNKARLVECRLVKTDLARAVLNEAQGAGTDFSQAILTDADLSQADLPNTRFFKSDLTGALFTQTRMENSEFRDVKLSGSDFSNADLTNAQFHRATGDGVIFDAALMHGAEFQQTKLHDPSFDGTRAEQLSVTESSLTRLRGGSETSLPGACFQDADLRGAVWDGADLQRAVFRGANLEQSDFSGCALQKSDFYRARAREAKFSSANLSDASMVSINLFRGDMTKADLTRTSLRGANLYEVEFLRANLVETNLEEANLARTKLERWRP